MNRIVVAGVAGVLATGCLWKNARSDESSRIAMTATLSTEGELAGGMLRGEAGMAGLYIAAEAEVRDMALAEGPAMMAPAGRDYRGLGMNLVLRASPLGILGYEHQLERYFDFGVEAGIGTGLVLWDDSGTEVGHYGAGSVGGWVELGTYSVGKRYVAIVGGVRLVDSDGPWRDELVATVGLAWSRRGIAGPLNVRD